MQIVINARPKVNKEGHMFLQLESEVEIFNPDKRDGVNVKRVTALWDTGATHTSMPMATAEELGLPFGKDTKTEMGVTVAATRYCGFYLRFPGEGIVMVPDGVAVPGARRQLVIGMDIMRLGVVTMRPDGAGGVVFTFRA